MRLVLIDEDGRGGAGAGARVELVDDAIVGRDPGCTLRLADPSVAPRHARVWRIGGAWHLSELDAPVALHRGGSVGTGGLARRLAVGDCLVFGACRLRVADAASIPTDDASPSLQGEIEGAIARQAGELGPVTVTRVTGVIDRANRLARALAAALARGLGPSGPATDPSMLTPAACVGYGRMLAAAFDLVAALQAVDAAASDGASSAPGDPDGPRRGSLGSATGARLLSAALDDARGAALLSRHLQARADRMRDRAIAVPRLVACTLDALAPGRSVTAERASGQARAWDAYRERFAAVRDDALAAAPAPPLIAPR